MKNKRLLQSLNFIDDKYIKEAQPKMTTSTSTSSLKRIITSVACFALFVALSLYLFIPITDNGPDVSAYEESEYYPLIATIADYRYRPITYKNNFQRFIRVLTSFSFGFTKKNDAAPGAPGNMETANPESGYVEVTDNQVEGVIESDIIKRTETHLFRLNNDELKVYTIDKENSTEIASIKIPIFDGELYNSYPEMYLSLDGKTVTLIKAYTEKNKNGSAYKRKVGIISIDVTDPAAPKEKKSISIDGTYNSARLVDGKLLLISEYSTATRDIDYSKPETFVPTVTEGDTTRCIKFNDIIYPEKLNSLYYSVVSLIDEDTLDILGANALLCFNTEVYVSQDNVYAVRQYTDIGSFDGGDERQYSRTMSDVAVLKYSDGTLEKKGILTVEGSVKDQYNMDEYDGHFRIVTSTNDTKFSGIEADEKKVTELLADKRRSATLTIFNLDSMAKIAEIRDFAPENEEATSVRFDKDKAYVCTAEVVVQTDPVYFFDLSDYSNITYTDTGIIDGFSTSLIQLGDGFLIGIGREGSYNKVEVYHEIDGKVESIDKYVFDGWYSTDYKSYFIYREADMFGFAVEGMYGHSFTYVLLAFDGYDLVSVEAVKLTERGGNDPSRIRAFMDDGYLYITGDYFIEVVKISEGE